VHRKFARVLLIAVTLFIPATPSNAVWGLEVEAAFLLFHHGVTDIFVAYPMSLFRSLGMTGGFL
jgi:hypothetical protein